MAQLLELAVRVVQLLNNSALQVDTLSCKDSSAYECIVEQNALTIMLSFGAVTEMLVLI
jgi:hypothetical protein